MFDGKDYHIRFEEACEELVYITQEDEVRSVLENIEWTFWEAIRGVFLLVSAGLSTLLFLPFSSIMNGGMRLLVGAVFIILVSLIIYWLLRFVFWYEISRHIQGRKFGK